MQTCKRIGWILDTKLKEGKYIIVLCEVGEVPIIFCTILSHIECIPDNRKLVSAGFFRFTMDGKVSVYGKSTTAKVKSRKQDAGIIQNEFFKESW